MIYMRSKLYVHSSSLELKVDGANDFIAYYRSLIPKYKRPQGTRYPAHISIIRPFEQSNLDKIRKFMFASVVWRYEPFIHQNRTRYFLKVYSSECCLLRRLAGLSNFREGFDCFHLTIGKKNDSL